jgi:replication initiation protein RepC
MARFYAACDKENGSVVFPSNAALSECTFRMNIRTLQYHLSKLVTARLILRKSCPSGKRYLDRRNNTVYGFDLSPVFSQASVFASLVEEEDRRDRSMKRIKSAQRTIRDIFSSKRGRESEPLKTQYSRLVENLTFNEELHPLEALAAELEALRDTLEEEFYDNPLREKLSRLFE